MYAAPPVIQTEVFTALPKELHNTGKHSAWVEERREHLAPQKVPRYVLFADDLPHTPTHKVAKATLKNDTTLKERAIDLQA